MPSRHGALAPCRAASRPRGQQGRGRFVEDQDRRGRCARPLTISMSCRSPIESVRTGTSGGIGARPSEANSARAFSLRSRCEIVPSGRQLLVAEEDVLGDGEVGNEREFLEDRADPGCRALHAGCGRGRRRRRASVRLRSAATAPLRIWMKVDFPAPFSPRMACTSPRVSGEVHLVQGEDHRRSAC